jgi:hypothetical protein
MIRLSCAAGALALAAVVGVLPSRAAAQAQPVNVADFQDDFRTGTFPAGWSYLWNANGPLGNRANYVPLGADNGRYESVANGTYPDPAPGSSVAAGSSPVDVVRYPDIPGLPPLPPIPQTFVRPGNGIAQGGIERAAIVAYTFSAQDFADAGVPAGGRADAFITAYDFAVAVDSIDGVSARVYRDTDSTPVIDFSLDNPPPFVPPFRFETTLDPRPRAIGNYGVGETVYFAIGPNLNDTNDELRLDFTLGLTPVPEPTSLALLAPVAMGVLMRRRRR